MAMRQELEPAAAAMSFGDRMMMNVRATARRQQEEVNGGRAWWPCQAWEHWLQHAIAEREIEAAEHQKQKQQHREKKRRQLVVTLTPEEKRNNPVVVVQQQLLLQCEVDRWFRACAVCVCVCSCKEGEEMDSVL